MFHPRKILTCYILGEKNDGVQKKQFVIVIFYETYKLALFTEVNHPIWTDQCGRKYLYIQPGVR